MSTTQTGAARTWITIPEAAAHARATRRTIHRWIEDGRFRSTRPIARGSGRRLIDRESFERFLRGEGDQ